MTAPRIKNAHEFYKRFIYLEELQQLLEKHKLPVAGSIPSVNWELFGAILTGDEGKGGYGSDLKLHEIKSAKETGSFEYQYHLHTGKQKLVEDMKVDHLFISYSPDYQNVDVRIISGDKLKQKFESWLPGLIANYKGAKRKQRYRRSISLGFVKKHGTMVMQIKKGELV